MGLPGKMNNIKLVTTSLPGLLSLWALGKMSYHFSPRSAITLGSKPRSVQINTILVFTKLIHVESPAGPDGLAMLVRYTKFNLLLLTSKHKTY